jgi:hypothetical protein
VTIILQISLQNGIKSIEGEPHRIAMRLAYLFGSHLYRGLACDAIWAVLEHYQQRYGDAPVIACDIPTLVTDEAAMAAILQEHIDSGSPSVSRISKNLLWTIQKRPTNYFNCKVVVDQIFAQDNDWQKVPSEIS